MLMWKKKTPTQLALKEATQSTNAVQFIMKTTKENLGLCSLIDLSRAVQLAEL